MEGGERREAGERREKEKEKEDDQRQTLILKDEKYKRDAKEHIARHPSVSLLSLSSCEVLRR